MLHGKFNKLTSFILFASNKLQYMSNKIKSLARDKNDYTYAPYILEHQCGGV